MKLLKELKTLFQKTRKINNIKSRASYIKNMMIIRGNQFFYETKKYLSKNDYMYFVYYDNLSQLPLS